MSVSSQLLEGLYKEMNICRDCNLMKHTSFSNHSHTSNGGIHDILWQYRQKRPSITGSFLINSFFKGVSYSHRIVIENICRSLHKNKKKTCPLSIIVIYAITIQQQYEIRLILFWRNTLRITNIKIL